MWIAWAGAAAIFAGLVAILAKVGLQHTPSNLATALRTVVVVVALWALVFAQGLPTDLSAISARSVLFLVLSGLATGASWLAYLRALQRGPVNPVVAIDNSSIAVTILLGMLLFGETSYWALKIPGIAAIMMGTLLMVQRLPTQSQLAPRRSWLPFALLAALFASLTAILGKVGITDIDATVGTALRTLVVLAMAWLLVVVTGELRKVRSLQRRDLVFLLLSGLATGLSWLCFYRALQTGPVSAVVPIDRLSLLVTVALAFVFLQERLTRRGVLGLALILVGTLAMIP